MDLVQMVFEKNLEEIDEEDLQSLIENRVLENKKLEYKQEIHLDTRDQKKEFLADISSFANASGGDIIYGIIENRDDGTPETLEGLDYNFDQLKGKIEGLIRDGTEPRVYVHIREIDIPNSKKALIIRIPKSWRSPHRIVFGRDYRFFSRNSNGKYHLDVEELKNAFKLSESLIEKIKSFREDRLSSINADESPIISNGESKTVIHIIPLNAFDFGKNYDLSPLQNNQNFRPIYSHAGRERHNLDGMIAYTTNTPNYVQIFRNGIIESVDVDLLDPQHDGKIIPSILYERNILESVEKYLSILNDDLNIETPILVFLSLLNVKGYAMATNSMAFSLKHLREHYLIDRDVLLLPEIQIEEYPDELDKTLKPCIDALWNACGYPESNNYDENGNWNPKR